ncbi:MAG: hypothetical protein ABDH21_05530 [bacterium]
MDTITSSKKRNLSLVFLASGLLDDKPKALIQTHLKTTILETVMNAFFSVNYQKLDVHINRSIVTYPLNYENDFKQLTTNYPVELVLGGQKLYQTIDNSFQAIKNYLQDDDYICFIATDTPLVTSEAVEDIIMRFSILDGDLFYPFVSIESYIVQLGKKAIRNRTFVKLARDKFCGTGIVIVNKRSLLKIWDNLIYIIENRKNPLKMARLFRINFLWLLNLILGRITVLQLEEQVERVFGIKPQGLLTTFANLAFNIDKRQDLEDYQEIVKNINNS